MMDVTRLGFDPIVPWIVLAALGALALASWGAYLVLRGRAWATRGVVLTLLCLALAGPAVIEEEREPLQSVAALILDRSESMSFGEREATARAAYERLRGEIEEDGAFELRVFESDRDVDGTNLIASLEGLLADVPRDRLAGAVIVSDGQVHDVPEEAGRLSELGPIHGVIVGDPSRGDRRVEIVEEPNFGIVGETVDFVIRVEDPVDDTVLVSVSLNGGTPTVVAVRTGEDTTIPIEVERRGGNILIVEAPPGDQELTLANNRTAANLSGVRDRLRVLLVTGRPNAAGRVWRDLLKSDPSVDLVHFTILRPPLKQDITPIEELALIAFPTEELFEEKLQDFDLIIFDQYERRGVVTMQYLSNMARYVEDGGALLIVAGEPFSGPASLARTSLAAVLPATPTGRIQTGRFTPEITDTGARHSVTEPLQGGRWGGWLRYIGAEAKAGDVLMSAPDGSPLLVVDRVGDGRVGQLLSDQIWLWARGHEGGGPFAELIRRLVHWMMKEPELEERRLELTAENDRVRASLRTIADTAPPLEIELPEGDRVRPDWTEIRPGEFLADIPAEQFGLYRAKAGRLEAVALNGPANPKEYVDLRSTTERLGPLAEETGGRVYRIGEDAGDTPSVRRVGRSGSASGGNWLGLRERGAYAVRSSSSQPLLPGLLAAALIALFLILAWRREGR